MGATSVRVCQRRLCGLQRCSDVCPACWSAGRRGETTTSVTSPSRHTNGSAFASSKASSCISIDGRRTAGTVVLRSRSQYRAVRRGRTAPHRLPHGDALCSSGAFMTTDRRLWVRSARRRVPNARTYRRGARPRGAGGGIGRPVRRPATRPRAQRSGTYFVHGNAGIAISRRRPRAGSHRAVCSLIRWLLVLVIVGGGVLGRIRR